MMKLTFTEGEAERTFVATGTNLQDGRPWDYTITGSWSPSLEDGKIQVELKITSRSVFCIGVELKGVFDPEEDSLRGTTVKLGYLDESLGEFVFKRDPDFVRFYPSPSTINARKRWEFAMASVLDRVRKQAWSPKRISKRIKNGKRFLELALKDQDGVCTPDERQEFLNLLPFLDEADVQFYTSLVKVDLCKTVIFE
jgi:hypothetical protein